MKNKIAVLIITALLLTVIAGAASAADWEMTGDFSVVGVELDAWNQQIDTLNAGENLHTVLCSETFDISQDKVNDPFPYNKDMTYRAVQKTIDFGLA